MKIIALQAENIKRLSAVAIRPDGNLVQITGRNGAGKTSVLDAIWWALAGAGNVQTSPIRKGEEKAHIQLDLGDLTVLRRFKAQDDGAFTTSLVVEGADGARYRSPQAMLDALVGELSFDPLEFTRLSPKEQYDRLRRLVPGVDFDALDEANRSDYDRRRDVNRRVNELRAQAGGIEIPDDLPEAPVDEDGLTAKMADASRHNAEIEREAARREQGEQRAVSSEQDADRFEAEAKDLRARAEEADERAHQARKQAADLRAEMSGADALPKPLDVTDLQEQLRQARQVNREIGARVQRDDLTSEADALAAEADKLTEAMAERTEAKRRAVAEADLPVDGLGFDDEGVTLGGLPFGQASDAEQLEASVAIAMAANPQLRVIRVRDGSLLDEDAMTQLAGLAEQQDCQVWIERVDTSGKVGFVVEDGHLADAEVRS